MKKVFLLIALACFGMVVNAQKETLKTFDDSLAYAIGCDIATGVKQMNINYDLLIQAISDCSKGKSKFKETDVKNILNEYQMRQQKAAQEETDKNLAEGKKFLAENSNSKSVYVTPSGLQYKILRQGQGRKPKATDKIKFHYKGTLIDGTVFDSSYDRGQPLTGEVNRFIAGWIEGLQLMPEGSKYIFYIPSNLGYGNRQAGLIPPGSVLIFEVELLEVLQVVWDVSFIEKTFERLLLMED